eukprot:TRINITY_DN685_c0_g5_i1.p1 TRINITY_DN685_c0_g5~~TRINITY_DN685_c0_g5_i1.p1  ORF type:complete len:299 (-),score=79.69 TRINITY_DN685_c0_g5_i1:109-900(-)
MSRDNLKGKVVVVTGAGSGIGEGIARKYASLGCKVAISDLFLESAERVAKEITSEGGEAFAIQMDVSDEESVANGMKRIKEELGIIDILINNAGFQHIEEIVTLSFKDWRRMMGVHLDGAFLCTRAVLPDMYENDRGGRIVFIGSVHSKVVSLLKAPYCTAKHGVVGLARVLAKEGAKHNVASNVICPGFVRTPLVDKQIPEQAAKLGMTEEEVVKKVMLKDTVDGEFTTIDDVAEACIFLTAHPSLVFTGQSLIVSHGWHME